MSDLISQDELRRLFPGASASTLRANQVGGSGLRPVQPKCNQGVPLDCAAPRKASGSVLPACRYRITFKIFSVRPLDWDNYRTKDIQDCLIQAGILPDDNWRILEGQVISEKAHSKSEERTEILIEPMP